MAARNFGYYLAPTYEHRALWYNAITAGLVLGLALWLIWRLWHSWGAFVAAWWAAEETMTLGCSVGYMWRPWEVKAGEDMCSALAGTQIGVYAAAVLAALALWRAARA